MWIDFTDKVLPNSKRCMDQIWRGKTITVQSENYSSSYVYFAVSQIPPFTDCTECMPECGATAEVKVCKWCWVNHELSYPVKIISVIQLLYRRLLAREEEGESSQAKLYLWGLCPESSLRSPSMASTYHRHLLRWKDTCKFLPFVIVDSLVHWSTT